MINPKQPMLVGWMPPVQRIRKVAHEMSRLNGPAANPILSRSKVAIEHQGKPVPGVVEIDAEAATAE
jgi:hypothetical protein